MTAVTDQVVEEFNASSLLGKATRGAAALGLRQVGVTGLNVVGAAVLARLVSPAVFGVYAVAAFVVGFLNFFAEAGLGASLIRQADRPSDRELHGAFTLQCLLAAAVIAIGWLLAPEIATSVHGPTHTTLLIRLALLSLGIAAFNLVPGAMLERELRFSRLGAINVAQALSFNGVAVIAAATGAPVIGVGIAMVSQALLGASLLAGAYPWRPRLVLSGTGLRGRLSFSIPLQASSILSSLKDAITPLFIGTLLGAHAVGLVEWSNSFAAYPVLALMALQQVYLPTFSRLQHDRIGLGRVVDSVLRGTNLIVAPLATLAFVLAVPITHVVFGEKWLTAVPAFRWFWIANIFVASASPLMSLLYACGRAKLGLLLTVMWMATTWALGVPFTHWFGITGYAAATTCVQLTNVFLFRAAQREAPVHILAQFWRPWLIATAVAGVVWLASTGLPMSAATLVPEMALGLAAYGGAVALTERRLVIQILEALRGRR
jgi:O-antigen/teichoic acid export membrane protein